MNAPAVLLRHRDRARAFFAQHYNVALSELWNDDAIVSVEQVAALIAAVEAELRVVS